MFGGGGAAFRLMRVRGIDVEIDITALLLIAFFTFPLATNDFPYLYREWGTGLIWAAAIGVGVLIIGSILVHELSHALVGMALGAQVQRIRLFIFGGATYFTRKSLSEGKDFLISIAGPLSNIALGAIFWLVQQNTPSREVLHVVSGYMIWVNFGLGIFNLLPGFPMDGGQALRSAMIVIFRRESLAALTVAVSGCIVGGLLAILAARSLTTNNMFGAIWTGLIAFWIISGSVKQYYDLPNYQPQSALGRLLWRWKPQPRANNVQPYVNPFQAQPVQTASADSGMVQVGQVMSRVEAVYTPNTTVAQFLQDSVERRLLDLQDAAVLQEGRLIGLVTRAMALAVPPADRPQVWLSQICAPANYFVAVSVNDDLSVALQAMNHTPDRPVTVFESDGRFAGLITRTDLERYLRRDDFRQSGTGSPDRPSNPYR